MTLPVLRPLIGMDKDEITAEAQRLGTYPISIIPDQDCCTLFTPRHPATKARTTTSSARKRRCRSRRWSIEPLPPLSWRTVLAEPQKTLRNSDYRQSDFAVFAPL